MIKSAEDIKPGMLFQDYGDYCDNRFHCWLVLKAANDKNKIKVLYFSAESFLNHEPTTFSKYIILDWIKQREWVLIND